MNDRSKKSYEEWKSGKNYCVDRPRSINSLVELIEEQVSNAFYSGYYTGQRDLEDHAASILKVAVGKEE